MFTYQETFTNETRRSLMCTAYIQTYLWFEKLYSTILYTNILCNEFIQSVLMKNKQQACGNTLNNTTSARTIKQLHAQKAVNPYHLF